MAGKEEKKSGKWKFTARERRGIILLIPLVAVLAWILYSASRPKFDGTAEVIGDRIAETAGSPSASGRRGASPDAGSESAITANQTAEGVRTDSFRPREFDPNTVTYEELREMGLASNAAAGLVRWRQYGKVFNIPEDFALVNGMTDSVYALFKPFIRIGEEYRIKPRAANPQSGSVTTARSDEARATAKSSAAPNESNTAGNSGSTDTVTDTTGTTATLVAVELSPFNPNEYEADDFTALGFSPRQSEAIIRFRESMGGFRSPEDIARCYVVSDEMYGRIKDYIEIPATGKGSGMIELNAADSLTLVSVRGIGARSASDIITYRERLGGYYHISQLRDLKVIIDKNYELIAEQIWADSCVIQKIDINFATPEKLGAHPYVTERTLRKILKNRESKGGWRTTEEMIEDNTLTRGEAVKLSPYLQFGPQEP